MHLPVAFLLFATDPPATGHFFIFIRCDPSQLRRSKKFLPAFDYSYEPVQ